MKKLFKNLENSDGVLHFLIVYFIGSMAAMLCHSYLGIAIAAIVALLKELWDAKYGNGWSWTDIAWDAAALLLLWLINMF